MTQTDVSNAVNWVINSYNGQIIAYPSVESGQCPAPICAYMNHLGIPVPSMANDRADGWGTNFPDVLVTYFTHEVFQPGKIYSEGTILMWNSPHIALVISSDGSNTVKVFEQNADPDGSGCHTFNREVNNAYHTCTYALIPIVQAPATYTYEATDPRLLLTTVDPTNWYNLNDLSVLTTMPLNASFPVAGVANRSDGSKYFMTAEDFGQAATTGVPTNNNGVSMSDLKETPVTPPVPAQTTVQNFIPTPVKPAQTYALVTTVPTYDTAGHAATGVSSSGTFPAGTYYVYAQQNDLYLLNITNTAQLVSCLWINGKDNVVPAPPEPEAIPETPVITNAGEADETWKATYKPFNPSQNPVTIPVLYNVILTYTVVDLDNKKANLTITQGRTIDIYGTFMKDGITYYRPRLKMDTNFEFWYGVPIFDTYVGQAILTKPVPVKKKPSSLLDKLYEVKEVFKEDEIKFLDIIPHWFKKK